MNNTFIVRVTITLYPARECFLHNVISEVPICDQMILLNDLVKKIQLAHS